MSTEDMAAYGGIMLGYGAILIWLGQAALAEIEFSPRARRKMSALPIGGLLGLTGLCATAFGTLVLSAAIWPC